MKLRYFVSNGDSGLFDTLQNISRWVHEIGLCNRWYTSERLRQWYHKSGSCTRKLSASKKSNLFYLWCRCYVGDRGSNEWRPCHVSMVPEHNQVFFGPKVSRRKSDAFLYDSDPDDSRMAPDLSTAPKASALFSRVAETPIPIAAPSNVTRTTAIKFGFS